MTECEKQDFAISMRGTGICEAKEEKRIFDLSTLTPQEALNAPSFITLATDCKHFESSDTGSNLEPATINSTENPVYIKL